MERMNFRELLERDGHFLYTNRGDSMAPLIREGKDLVMISRIREPLKKYDVPLYQRDTGEYVLHRILKIRPDGYVLCGDNRWQREYGIQDRQMVGVLTAVIREGKEFSLEDGRYRACVRLWCGAFPLRVLLLRSRNLLRKIRGALQKKRRRNTA